jgi:hypothetical protein
LAVQDRELFGRILGIGEPWFVEEVELKEALGYTSLYNEGLGSVSGRYQYDRVVSRDLPETSRPQRPWQK